MTMVRPGCNEPRQVPVAEVRPDSWVRRLPEPPKDDTVTLTKSQFQQILEVIGQVNVVSGDEKVFNCQENIEYQSSSNLPENETHPVVTKSGSNNDICETPQKSPEKTNRLHVPCPLDVVISCPASLSWSPLQTELSPSKLSPLSKIEQKRLQWQKEKAEMIDWNPWGKPGAGAPPKKTQVVAPITPRTNNNQLLMVQTSGAMPFTGPLPTGISSCIPSPNHSRIFTGNLEQHNFIPNKSFTNYTCVAQPIKPVPPVFKSSIAFGNTDNESISSDFYKRQQWLHELEYQREEQRRMQEQIQMSQVADATWGNSNCKDEVESISISVDGSILPGAADYQKRNYIRGQGFQMDPVSAALADERRQKAQEYQQAIRLQMEEKQNRMQAERLRKKQEEEAEERRLQAERARIQAEYEEEQMRIKQKAEMEERKQQALISAVQEARAQAEIEKKSRKIQKLIPLPTDNSELLATHIKQNEDVASLSSNIESKLKIEDSNLHGSSIENKPNLVQESEPNIDFSSKKELGVQTVPVSDSEKNSCYVVDRVLTPSIFRVRAKAGSHGKEFGTQTDIHYGKYTTDAESTESNTSSFHNPIGKRIIRVQHSKPYKAQRRIQCSETLHPSERPKWGVNQPSKTYVRMTERDPHFSKRKRLQEIRKQHWARELAAQKSNQTSRRPIGNSYPCLRTHKVVSSSDCTVGYSSSEFETRSCHHFRSNSTPRYRQPSGFRSECGSAETIAYFNYNPSAAHRSQVSKSVLHCRDSHSSDNLPSIIGGSEPSPSHHIHSVSRGNSSLPPMRRKWHSQETFYPTSNYHSFSPPHVPGVYPRILGENHRFELPPPHVPQRRKWSDQESFDLESVVRSRVEEESLASSARSSEKSQSASASSAGSSREKSASNQNPLVCPEVVTGRPTPRQDRILQNLSSLRQGLLKKQKELESLIRRPPPYLS